MLKSFLKSKSTLHHNFKEDEEAYHEHGIYTEQDVVHLCRLGHELFVAVGVADFLHWHDSQQRDDNAHNSCYKWHDK